MTTATLRTTLAVAVVGVLLVAAGAVSSGSPAAYGALIGALLVLAVLGTGALLVGYVARTMPAASLLFAMLTYTLQIVLLLAFFAAMTRGGLLDGNVDRGWLGGAIIAGALVWTIVQVVLATTARIPAYDLPAAPSVRDPEAGAR
jgi:ATP synthase protein I